MATSLEKLGGLVEQLLDATDDDLKQIAPAVPTWALRPLLPMIPKMLPDTVEELEQLLDRGRDFIDGLRSDPV